MEEIGPIPASVMSRLHTIAKSAYSRFETVQNSYELAYFANLEGLPGSFCECGVAAGSQVGAMALANQQCGISRTIWLFDSFCGIPLAGPQDDQQPGIGAISHDVNVDPRALLVSSGITVHSRDNVERNLARWGVGSPAMRFVPGWFEDMVAQTDTGPIAVLRLDGDLYSSTRVCLDALYSRVVPGGFVIIDDYALKGCRTAVHETMGESFAYNVVPTTDKVIWWRKQA